MNPVILLIRKLLLKVSLIELLRPMEQTPSIKEEIQQLTKEQNEIYFDLNDRNIKMMRERNAAKRGKKIKKPKKVKWAKNL